MTAIVSVLTGIPVRKDIAMTGEVTLRGNAKRHRRAEGEAAAAFAGRDQDVLIPEENAKDLAEIPDNVKAAGDRAGDACARCSSLRWCASRKRSSGTRRPRKRQPPPAAQRPEQVGAGQTAH